MIKPAYIRANSVTLALEVIGDRWVLMLLQQALFGVTSFEAFQRRLALARGTLSSRLQHMVAHGLFDRVPIEPGSHRHIYVLTEKGRDLFYTGLMMDVWQRAWAPPDAPLMHMRHNRCGAQLEPELRCGSCKVTIDPRQVRFRDGPGASLIPRETRRRRRTSLDNSVPPGIPVSPELLELLGDRWTPQVAAAAFFGVRRFEDFRSAMQLASNILADRLKRLLELGVFRLSVYQSAPRRAEYRLTDKGRALYPLMLTLMQWGDRWCALPEGPPLLLTHQPCGAELQPELVCAHCQHVIELDDVSMRFEWPMERRRRVARG